MLDLFAGAGSLGLEAWSRYAESVTFVEQHPAVFKNLEENIRALDCDELSPVKCFKGDAIRWLSRAGRQFDLILADPPYDLPDAMQLTLDGIVEHSVLTEGGTLVYELRSSDRSELPANWDVVRDKKYGAARVLILKQKIEDES